MHRVPVIRIVLIILFTLSAASAGETSWNFATQPQVPEISYLGNLVFADHLTAYLAGTVFGESVILKSTDGGHSWQILYRDSTRFTLQKSFFLNSATGWVVGDSGTIWFTNDGGNSWNDYSTHNRHHHLQAVYAASPQTIYVAGDSGQVLKSTDGGTTWNDISPGVPYNFREICGFNSNRLILVSQQSNHSFFVTQDGGNTWTEVCPPYHYTMLMNKMYSCRGLPGGKVYATGISGAIFVSNDYGMSWQFLTSFFPFTTIPLKALYVDNNGTVWCGNQGNIFRSDDGGGSWDTLHIPTAAQIARIAAFPGHQLYVFTYGGHLLSSGDGGSTFQPLLSWPNLPFVDVEWNGQRLFVASSYGGEMSMSTDQGQSWSYPVNTITHATSGITDVCFTDSLSGYYCSKGQIGRTSDGGNSWELVYNGLQPFRFIYFASTTHGLVGGDVGTLLMTNDAGSTWSPINPGTSASLYRCTFIDSLTGFMVGRKAQNGVILKTTDGGNTWQETIVADSGIYLLRDIAFTDASTGFAISSNGYLVRTVDGGNNWTVFHRFHNSYLPNHPVDLRFISLPRANHIIVGGDNGALFVSQDAGTSWTQYDVPPEVRHLRLHAIAWTSDNHAFIASENGYILTMNYTGIETPGEVPGHFTLLPGYPNPFNSRTTIRFYLVRGERVKLTIYNLLGQRVRTLFSGFLSAGWHRLSWDARNDFGLPCPGGVYFLHMNTNREQRTIKLVYLK